MDKQRFYRRIAVFIGIGPFSLWTVLSGPPWIDRAALVVTALSAWELSGIIQLIGIPIKPRWAVLYSVLLAHVPGRKLSCLAFTASSFHLISSLFRNKRQTHYAWSCLMGVFISLPINMALNLRRNPLGKQWLLWGISTTWLNDFAAYVLGPKVGGPGFPRW
ncbi:MAG: phosphatidate cytidylyltransferase, partial [Bacillota bacterium]